MFLNFRMGQFGLQYNRRVKAQMQIFFFSQLRTHWVLPVQMKHLFVSWLRLLALMNSFSSSHK